MSLDKSCSVAKVEEKPLFCKGIQIVGSGFKLEY